MASGRTQNGWAIDPPRRGYAVPDSGVSLSLVADNDAATLLIYAAWRFHTQIEPLDGGQCGGYDTRPIGGLGGSTSNHRSGTAVDLNYSNYPQGAHNMTAAHRAVARDVIAVCGGALRWGGDYGGGTLVDEQHFELNTTDTALIAGVAAKLRGAASTGGSVPSSFATAGAIGTGGAASVPAPEPLPAIGPVPTVAAVPLAYRPYVSDDNRLDEVKVNGQYLTAAVTAAVTAASMSFSSGQVGQFELTVADTGDAPMLAQDLFALDSPLDFGDQHMTIRSLEVTGDGGGPRITVQARSRVIGVLEDADYNQGKGTWGEVDVSTWYTDRAREAGAAGIIVQPGLRSLVINRNESTGTESTWGVMVRVGRALGLWVFEYENIVVAAKPSWLVTRQGRREWALTWTAWADYTGGLTGMPAYTHEKDAGGETLTFELLSADGHKARPGDRVTLDGSITPANGEWIVTAVTPPVSQVAATKVSCVRPVDPDPPTST